MKIPLFSVLASFALAPVALHAAPKITTAAGANPADITAAVTAFRADVGLGGPGNVAPGPFATGFRNVNWDGAPDSLAAPLALPADFFNNNVRRGAVFTTPTPGATVQVSATIDNASGTAVRFGNIDPSYATRFKAFTEQRIFAAVGSTIIDTAFVPASPGTAATVNGFGAVFCDVDLANTSSIECFDAAGKSLGKFFAPVADNGLSFVGVFFPDGERVARVRLTQGNLPLARGNVDTATQDVVATDDFMYGEPLAIVTDATLVNVSNRARIAAVGEPVITGFVIGGTQPKNLLVRAVGPSLSPFVPAGNVSQLLANPQLSVVDSNGQVVVTNDDWGNRPELVQAAARVGAFPLSAASLDAAALVVLNPGAYTVVTSGVGTVGTVLTEVYEVK